MQKALDAILKRFITRGQLTLRWPDGRLQTYAGPPDSGPIAGMALLDHQAVRGLVLNPTLALGEAYMDGRIMPLDCTLYDLLEVLILNTAQNSARHPFIRLAAILRRLKRRIDQYNPAHRAQRNVAHHYDLNGRLYSLFLDRDRQYSCAYFPTGNETLEEAQIAKKRHIAAKLLLDRPGLRVLDIGCGWGGLALSLARDYGAQVLGVTLSQEQWAEAQARAAAEGLTDRVRFELRDYRSVTEKFDRIVSVGMFEHVGVNHYGEFFATVRRCLTDDGVMLLHTIGRSNPPGSTNAWITKYIFPGGYSPALSEVVAAVERSGMGLADVEVLRLHYAETLCHWRRRFAANRDAITTIYDERFCRMFEFYLAASELTFRHDGHMVFQLQIVPNQRNVPLTRDYISDTERPWQRDSGSVPERFRSRYPQ